MSVRFIPELAGITPYQPGLPIEVVQRRFGLEQVVKLASNEFPLPPFPEVNESSRRRSTACSGIRTVSPRTCARPWRACTTAAPSRSP